MFTFWPLRGEQSGGYFNIFSGKNQEKTAKKALFLAALSEAA